MDIVTVVSAFEPRTSSCPVMSCHGMSWHVISSHFGRFRASCFLRLASCALLLCPASASASTRPIGLLICSFPSFECFLLPPLSSTPTCNLPDGGPTIHRLYCTSDDHSSGVHCGIVFRSRPHIIFWPLAARTMLAFPIQAY